MTDPQRNRPVLPLVTPLADRSSVLVELSARHAAVLARVLAHYDLLVSGNAPTDQVADGYHDTVWHNTLIGLLRAAEQAGGTAAVDRDDFPAGLLPLATTPGAARDRFSIVEGGDHT